MSSYADHQRMVTLEQRVATLEVRAAEAERLHAELETRVLDLIQRGVPIPLGGQHTVLGDAPSSTSSSADPPSPYEQWREKKVARKAAE